MDFLKKKPPVLQELVKILSSCYKEIFNSHAIIITISVFSPNQRQSTFLIFLSIVNTIYLCKTSVGTDAAAGGACAGCSHCELTEVNTF